MKIDDETDDGHRIGWHVSGISLAVLG